MKQNSKRKRSYVLIVTAILLVMSVVMTGCSEEVSGNKANSYEFKVTEQMPEFYVNDFAHLFSDEQKATMMEKAIRLDEESGGIQVVISTVESLSECTAEKGVTIEQASYAMYKQYGIGEDDMGILVLFSSGDRDVRIETGYQMQVYITDSKAGQLLDNYGMDYFRNDQFAEGLMSLQDGIISEIQKSVPLDWRNSTKQEEEEVVPEVTETKEHEDVAETITAENKSKQPVGLYATFSALMATLLGLIFSIKAFLKSKLKGEETKRKSDQALENQREQYEKKIREMQEAHCDNLNAKERFWSERLSKQSDSYESTVSGLQSEIQSKEEQIAQLRKEKTELSFEISELTSQLDKLKEKFSRAQALHPEADFEAEVQQMIEKEFEEVASKIDAELSECLKQSADKDKISYFRDAIEVYEGATAEVAKYLKTDIRRLRELHSESIALREEYERAEQEKRDRAAAQSAYEEIVRTTEGMQEGTYRNYKVLKKVYDMYSGLSSAAKEFFPDVAVLEFMKRLFREAEEDQNNFNGAKRAETEVRRVTDRIYSASESDRDSLNRAMSIFKKLRYTEQQYFDSNLLSKLKRLIDEADEDHRRKEERRRREAEEKRRRQQREEEERRRRRREEEERRRRMNSSSSSSFGGGSHGGFSGHGGRPSGGGASRHF